MKAGQLGLTQRDVSEQHADFAQRQQSGGSEFLAESGNGISYNVGVQTSQYRIDSLDELLRTPVTAASTTLNATTPGSPAYGNPANR